MKKMIDFLRELELQAQKWVESLTGNLVHFWAFRIQYFLSNCFFFGGETNFNIEVPSLKLTACPWKSPWFLVNTIRMLDFPWRFVSFRECIFWGGGEGRGLQHWTLGCKPEKSGLHHTYWWEISRIVDGWMDKSTNKQILPNDLAKF